MRDEAINDLTIVDEEYFKDEVTEVEIYRHVTTRKMHYETEPSKVEYYMNQISDIRNWPKSQEIIKGWDEDLNNWEFYEHCDSPCTSGGPVLLAINKVDDKAFMSFDDCCSIARIVEKQTPKAAALMYFFPKQFPNGSDEL